MKGVYNKLCRDKIPEIMITEGFKPDFKKLNSKQYKEELFKKLKEETEEVISAKDKKSLIEELADIQEVLIAIYRENKIECSDVTKCARLKRKKKGAFDKRIFLKTVK